MFVVLKECLLKFPQPDLLSTFYHKIAHELVLLQMPIEELMTDILVRFACHTKLRPAVKARLADFL